MKNKSTYLRLKKELENTNTLFRADKLERELRYLNNILSGKQLRIKWQK